MFDVTLDCEDGAPVGKEREHARWWLQLAQQAVQGSPARVAARVHPVDHPSFAADMDTIAGQAAAQLCHIMVPKVGRWKTCCALKMPCWPPVPRSCHCIIAD